MKRFLAMTLLITTITTSNAYAFDWTDYLTIDGVSIRELGYIKDDNQNQNRPVNKPEIKPIKPEVKPIKPEHNNQGNENVGEISQMEKEVVLLVNQARSNYGLKPLKIDYSVSKVARLKSEDMKKKLYFSHTSPTYGSPFDMLKQFGISYKRAGENIAKGQKTPKDVVNAWLNSEGHRANILSKNFTHIGVGVAKKGNTPYWTQLFITK